MRLLPARSVILVALLLLPACGRSLDESDPEQAQRKAELEDIREIYKLHMDDKKRPPVRLAEVRGYEIVYPAGYAALRDGQVVMLWGSSPAGGARVLAYEASATDRGGLVLLLDGDIQAMTAEQLQAALQAGR